MAQTSSGQIGGSPKGLAKPMERPREVKATRELHLTRSQREDIEAARTLLSRISKATAPGKVVGDSTELTELAALSAALREALSTGGGRCQVPASGRTMAMQGGL
jgi:hypothetical protein